MGPSSDGQAITKSSRPKPIKGSDEHFRFEWEGLRPSLARLVDSLLSRCPREHAEGVLDEVESAFRYAESRAKITDPKRYALAIVRHKVADHLRDPYHRSTVSLAPTQSADDLSPAADFSRQVDFSVAVHQELSQLSRTSPRVAQAFIEYINDKKPAVIARSLKVSVPTVYRWIKDAQKYMRSALR